MTKTTTHRSKLDCVLSIDDASGTLTSLAGSSTKVSLGGEAQTATARVFEGKIKISADSDETVEIEGLWTTATGEARDLVETWYYGGTRNTPRTVQIDIPDSSPGSRRYTAEFTILNYKPFEAGGTEDTAERMRFTATLENDTDLSAYTIT